MEQYRTYGVTLCHHGITGQKWGVRNGPPYPLDTPANRVKKTAKTKKKVDEIVETLSPKEKARLGITKEDPQYLSLEQGEHVLHRVLKEVGDVPVSFFDILDNGNTIELALATRSGDAYRGKGYSSKAAKQAINYIQKHPEKRKGRDIIWGVKEDNKASIAIAKKNGFVIDPKSKHDGWVNYVLKGE